MYFSKRRKKKIEMLSTIAIQYAYAYIICPVNRHEIIMH